jgi:hypothetical protein
VGFDSGTEFVDGVGNSYCGLCSNPLAAVPLDIFAGSLVDPNNIFTDSDWAGEREKQQRGEVDLRRIPTEQQVADGLTKVLPRDKFEAFRNALGLA